MVALTGRGDECAMLDGLVDAICAGESVTLLVHGEPGVGKTALLEYLASNTSNCRVTRAAGVEMEMELAFATLHQLCLPMTHQLTNLPPPQQDALETALGMIAGPAPDPFLVGLAVLNLFSSMAEERPLLCLVDDVQWLDRASAQVLAFVARRLVAESVGLVFAARVPSADLGRLPKLLVRGIKRVDARALLDAQLTGPIDARIRDQIVVEARGNPLALLELPRGLTPHELAGGFGLPGAVQLSAAIEETFHSRLNALPEQTRQLMLLAAAEPTGDVALMWRAAQTLGIGADAAVPAIQAGLWESGTRMRFRHPLVRCAAYRSSSFQEKQQAHRALAEVMDPQLDPDRRAWHRAHAASGPDESVAEELARSADRAQARGGVAAAAAFLERAATLTLDPAQRADRALAAASAKIQAGAFDVALDMLTIADAGSLNDFQQARVDLIRAQLAFVTSRGSDAPTLLLRAAQRLESVDVALSRATYLDSLAAALFAGRLAVGSGAVEVATAACAAPRPHTPRAPDLLLDGLAAHYTEGYSAGLPILRNALIASGSGMSPDEELRWVWLSYIAAMHLWDDERWRAFSDRNVELARRAGALGDVPLALSARAFTLLFAGDLAGAASLIEELQLATEAMGSDIAPYAALGLAALRGDEAKATSLIEATVADVSKRGEGNGITVAAWANAVLNNGLGNYERAMVAAQKATSCATDLGSANWALVELVEGAVRSGMNEIAAEALRRLRLMTSATGTDWALGVEARSCALLSEGEVAESHYLKSIDRLGRTQVGAELARTHLVYGEWLRRQRRRAEARAQLRTALDMLEAMGMDAFAERARRELRATGETARKRATARNDQELTAQEAQVTRLARDGLSNPEIGVRLFISARTVQYHLSKVFAKLGVNSRSELDRVLPSEAAAPELR